MLKDQDKYQNLVSQIHDLNRQNLLNENENIERLSNKIDGIEKSLNKIDELKKQITKLPKETYKEEKDNKLNYFILGISLLNTIVLLYIVYITYFLDNRNIVIPESTSKKETIEKKITIKKDNVLSLNEEVLLGQTEEYEEIIPLIRKGTIYTCKDDINTYKIPYTIEIKGKLFSDRFLFILQKDSTTKDCTIKKEHM